jgi:hypothetical protein
MTKQLSIRWSAPAGGHAISADSHGREVVVEQVDGTSAVLGGSHVAADIDNSKRASTVHYDCDVAGG